MDDSDDTFFQAFHRDIKNIGHAIFFRKKILGIRDERKIEIRDACDTKKVVTLGGADEVEREELIDQLEHDVNLMEPKSEDDLEEHLVNEIDYLVGCVFKQNTETKTQREIVDILIKNDNLYAIRKALADYVMHHRIL